MSSGVAVRQAAREGWLASLGRRLPGPSFALGLVIVVGMALLSFLAPLLGLGDPLAMNVKDRLQAPSLAHLFGTDELGRDVFVRVIYGGKIDLTLGFVTATVSLIIGMAVGTIAGFYRGTRETVDMQLYPYAILALRGGLPNGDHRPRDDLHRAFDLLGQLRSQTIPNNNLREAARSSTDTCLVD